MENPLKYSISTRIRERFINKLLEPSNGDLVLDAGCGLGYNCESLSKLGVKVLGTDIDKEVLSVAKKLYPYIDFIASDSARSAFKECSFDKIVCSEVLEHVNDDSSVLEDLYKILKPGGQVLITVPCTEGLFGSFFKDIGHAKDAGLETHFRKGYSCCEITNLCKKNRFKLLSCSYGMNLFTEFYMGLAKFIYLLFISKNNFRKQSDFMDLSQDSILVKLNSLILPILLKIDIIERALFSKFLKGHLLVLLLTK
jgi:ubiquinone/menaquinone biosynthesis C-methylase UbiE